MIVCPVCEHPQDRGEECDVCGKRLAAADRAPVAAAPPLAELEPTRAAPVAVSGAAMIELDPTAQASAAEVAPDPSTAAALEPTAAAPVDADAPRIPDVEETSLRAAGEARTALPAFPTCRYCRAPAMPGERMSGSCGRALPLVRAASPGAGAAGHGYCGCGAPATSGRCCPACGARPHAA